MPRQAAGSMQPNAAVHQVQQSAIPRLTVRRLSHEPAVGQQAGRQAGRQPAPKGVHIVLVSSFGLLVLTGQPAGRQQAGCQRAHLVTSIDLVRARRLSFERMRASLPLPADATLVSLMRA